MKFDLTQFNSTMGNLLDTLRELPTLDPIIENQMTPLIIGQAAQRRIDDQGYKPLKPKYALRTAKQRAGKGILRLSDGLYTRLGIGEGFMIKRVEGGLMLEVELTDPVARGQAKGDRPPLEADQQLADDCGRIQRDGIDEKLKKLK